VKIIDLKLLESFRQKTRCDWCRQPCERPQPHHVFGRGQEGCRRLDVAINLLSLCVYCHHNVHAGHIERADLLAIVAKREKTTQDEIEREVYRLRRL